MLTNITEWNVDPFYLFSFTETTMKALGSFKPNIMDIHSSPEFDKFISIWIKIISAMTIKRSFLNHLAGALIQIYPSLMLQQVSKDKSANIEALSKQLTLWQEGKLEDILNEAYDIQRKLNRSKTKPSASSKKNQEKLRFIKAVRNGDIRGAARSIDPDNFGLQDWNEDV